MANLREAYVYTLSDPRTGAVRYVGKTLAPDARLKGHTSKYAAPNVRAWVAELKAVGHTPIMTLVEQTTDHEAYKLENKIVAQYRKAGAGLLNVAPVSPRPRRPKPIIAVEPCERFYTVRQLSVMCRVDTPTIYKWIERGKLGATKYGRIVRVTESQWSAFVASSNAPKA